MDEKGLKMSKSLGNVVDPRIVIDGGKNQKVSYVNLYIRFESISNLITTVYQIHGPWIYLFIYIFVEFVHVILRRHLHMELMFSDSGFQV